MIDPKKREQWLINKEPLDEYSATIDMPEDLEDLQNTSPLKCIEMDSSVLGPENWLILKSLSLPDLLDVKIDFGAGETPSPELNGFLESFPQIENLSFFDCSPRFKKNRQISLRSLSIFFTSDTGVPYHLLPQIFESILPNLEEITFWVISFASMDDEAHEAKEKEWQEVIEYILDQLEKKPFPKLKRLELNGPMWPDPWIKSLHGKTFYNSLDAFVIGAIRDDLAGIKAFDGEVKALWDNEIPGNVVVLDPLGH